MHLGFECEKYTSQFQPMRARLSRNFKFIHMWKIKAHSTFTDATIFDPYFSIYVLLHGYAWNLRNAIIFFEYGSFTSWLVYLSFLLLIYYRSRRCCIWLIYVDLVIQYFINIFVFLNWYWTLTEPDPKFPVSHNATTYVCLLESLRHCEHALLI